MSEYHKIVNPYKRDESTHKVKMGVFTCSAVEFTATCTWDWTEKVDGTNIRVIYPAAHGGIEVRGKTDRAQLKADLLKHIHEGFNLDVLREKCASATVEEPIIFYGEGYGPGIQKVGSLYGPTKRFILFDVRVGKWWLKRGDVIGLAEALGIDVVPTIAMGTLYTAIDIVRAGPQSPLAARNWDWKPGDARQLPTIEGLVGRPRGCELFDRNGDRLIVKVKACDFVEGA